MKTDVLLLLLSLCLFSITVFSCPKILYVILENIRYEKQFGIKHEVLLVFLAGGLTDTDTLPYFHRFHQLSTKPQEKLASDNTTLSFLLLLVVIFIPQLCSNKHQPPVFFCPHPSFPHSFQLSLPFTFPLVFR